jgi:hypothetical protein
MGTIQANLGAGVLGHLVYGRNEVGLGHFHRMLDEALGEPAS